MQSEAELACVARARACRKEEARPGGGEEGRSGGSPSGATDSREVMVATRGMKAPLKVESLLCLRAVVVNSRTNR